MCEKFEKIKTALYATIFTAFIVCALGCADEALADNGDVMNPFVRIEIERDTPNEKQHIVREFHNLEELLMWFEDKVESKTCDPYVTSIKMYPYGKFSNE